MITSPSAPVSLSDTEGASVGLLAVVVVVGAGTITFGLPFDSPMATRKLHLRGLYGSGERAHNREELVDHFLVVLGVEFSEAHQGTGD